MFDRFGWILLLAVALVASGCASVPPTDYPGVSEPEYGGIKISDDCAEFLSRIGEVLEVLGGGWGWR